MKLIYLEYFLQVVKYGSISKAAEALMLKKSNLSTYIKLLEDDFNAILLTRTSKGVELTPEGQQVYLWADHLLSEQQHLKKLFQTRQNNLTLNGTINVYLTASINADSYNDFLYDFSVNHPHVQLSFHENSLKESIAAIASDENSAGIMLCDNHLLNDINNNSNLLLIPFDETSFVVYAAKNSLFAKASKSISLKNLSKIPLLIYCPSLTEKSPVVEILQQYVHLTIAKTTPNLHLLQMLLNTGLYATIGVKHTKGMEEYTAISIRDSIKLTSCFVINRNAVAKPVIHSFIKTYFDTKNIIMPNIFRAE